MQRMRSTTSQLGCGNTKSPSNVSGDSFYTAGARSNDSRRSQIEDSTQDRPDRAAKVFAERAWKEDPDFVEREKLVEWLGSPSEIRQQALGYYMAHFEFGGSDIDEAIRQLCNKLYIKGETQQIDRILEAFSEQYVFQNHGCLWQVADIVHVVSFAIFLLNSDLQSTELNLPITSSRFVENTIEAIRAQLQQETPTSPSSNDPPTPSFPAASPHPNIDRRPSNPNRGSRINSRSSLGLGSARSSWVVTQVSDAGEPRFGERWYAEASRELASIYNRVRAKPILQTRHDKTPAPPQSKHNGGLFGRGSAKQYHSLRGESPYGHPSPSTSGVNFVLALRHRVSSSMSSIPRFLGITSNQSVQLSASSDTNKLADSHWAKTGLLLWKPTKPTAGRIAKPKRWLSVLVSIRSSIVDLTGPVLSGSNITPGRQLGTLSLLHALAIEVPAPKGTKVRSFDLTLANGEAHMFKTQDSGEHSESNPGQEADAEVLAWVRACNYHAALYSRAPLPNAVTNVEYGWTRVVGIDDRQGSTEDRSRNLLVDDWIAPNLPSVEAHEDVEAQFNTWSRQVKRYTAEYAAHGELRGKMMNLYRSGSIQAQRALNNWEKKTQFLLVEMAKYQAYADTLRKPELHPQVLQQGPEEHTPQHMASIMYRCLIQHGCPDLNSSFDPHGFSSSAVAEGGFGDIWTGTFHCDGTKLAIKVLRFTSSTNDAAKKELKRVTREIYYWSKLDHENVNKLMGVIMFRERLGMVSEWMENGNLRQYLSRNGDVDRYGLCIQISRGVAYIHGVNMVHGDLKACNILVSSTGIIKITDFDYSIFPECSLAFSATTRMGGGTLRWMAPELLIEDNPPQRSTKTDIYALGMTFLETITNNHPYPECRDIQIYRKLAREEHPKRLVESFPENEWGSQMWNLLLQCWNFDSTARPIANEVLEVLLGIGNKP